MASLLYHAQQYLKHGFSILRTDGRKAPVGAWKRLNSQALTEEETAGYFAHPAAKGLGVICGRVSGNLEVIDVDTKHALDPHTLLPELLDAIAALDAALVAKLVITDTPSGGNHIFYRCPGATIPGSRKLATRHSTPEELARNPHDKVHCYIETRGEGGYVVAMPSTGYTVRQGRMGAVPVISVAEREAVMEAVGAVAHMRDLKSNLQKEGREHPYGVQAVKPSILTSHSDLQLGEADVNDAQTARKGHRYSDISMRQHSNAPTFQPSSNHSPTTFQTPSNNYPPSPIDDYNQRGDVVALLVRHGWTVVGHQGEKVVMKRPGTTDSKSSGDYHQSKRLFGVFSTSTEFKAMKGYSPAGVYAVLECGGDFKAAARKLREEGYGGKKEEGGRRKKGNSKSKAANSKSQNGGEADAAGVPVSVGTSARSSSCQQTVDDQTQGTRKGHRYSDTSPDHIQSSNAPISQHPPTSNPIQPSSNAPNVFWRVNPMTQKPVLVLTELERFMSQCGGYGLHFYGESGSSFRLVCQEGGVVEEVATEHIKKFVKGYVESLPAVVESDDGDVNREDLLEMVYRSNAFADNLYEYLPRLDTDFLKDTKERAYYPFRNGVVEVSAEGVQLRQFDDLMIRRSDDCVMADSCDEDAGKGQGNAGIANRGKHGQTRRSTPTACAKDDESTRVAPEHTENTTPLHSNDFQPHQTTSDYSQAGRDHHPIIRSPNHPINNPAIWRSTIIPHDIAMPDEEMNVEEIEFFRFLKMVCDDDAARIRYAMQVIGYLLHGYKDPARSYCIVLAEETDDERKGGGTGKGIFFKALGKLVPQLVMDGKNFRLDKNFAFQRVQPEHRLVVIDDVRSKVDFEGFYSMITEGFTIEKKNKDEVYVPYKDAPKIIFSTNYAIPAAANHARRRQRVVEFARRFNAGCTPMDVFGHTLFEDWDDAEWGRFYNFLFACVQKYLKEGIGERETSAMSKRKQVRLLYGEDFLEWWETYSGGDGCGEVKYVGELYDSFLSGSGFEKKDYSIRRFKKALEESAMLFGYKLRERKDSHAGGKKEIRLVKPGIK